MSNISTTVSEKKSNKRNGKVEKEEILVEGEEMRDMEVEPVAVPIVLTEESVAADVVSDEIVALDPPVAMTADQMKNIVAWQKFAASPAAQERGPEDWLKLSAQSSALQAALAQEHERTKMLVTELEAERAKVAASAVASAVAPSFIDLQPVSLSADTTKLDDGFEALPPALLYSVEGNRSDDGSLRSVTGMAADTRDWGNGLTTIVLIPSHPVRIRLGDGRLVEVDRGTPIELPAVGEFAHLLALLNAHPDTAFAIKFWPTARRHLPNGADLIHFEIAINQAGGIPRKLIWG